MEHHEQLLDALHARELVEQRSVLVGALRLGDEREPPAVQRSDGHPGARAETFDDSLAIDQFGELYDKIEEIRRLQSETATGREALMPAVLERCFQQEL